MPTVSKLQRFLACLLCALLISAVLDSVPDPPIIKPHGDKIATVYLVSPQQFADRSVGELVVKSPSLLHHVDDGVRSDHERVLPLAPLLKQASDSSPPAVLI